MKKRIALLSLIVVLCAGAIIAFKLMGDSTFTVPEDSKAAIAFTTGRRVLSERAKVCFYDKNGRLLKQEKYKASLSDGCISFEPESGDYNLFTHENIYFSNGKNIHNEEMDDLYSFASYRGWDDVYKSGYIKKWNMFYKHIPHGLSYEHRELGYFDLITLYNESGITNIRVTKSGRIASDDKEPALYNLVEYENSIAYEKILQKDSEFIVREGTLDIGEFFDAIEFDRTNGVFYLINALWSDGFLYVTLGVGEGELSDKYVLCFSKKGSDIEYQYSTLVDFKNMNIPSGCLDNDTVVIDNKNTIEYYTAGYPFGMISYDKDSRSFEFYPYFEADMSDEDIGCYVKQIEGKVFALIADYTDGNYTIYQKTQNKEFKKIAKINRLENLYLADFYVR